jgi:MtN3 and saliva related transmembrane protein
MEHIGTAVGLAAALCTTASYFPQLKKCWQTGSAGDLSLVMFSVLAVGIALWVVYGILQSDLVITLSNGVSLVMLGGILYCKIRYSARASRSRAG